MPSELLQEIERAACAGKKPPEGLEPAEMMLYYMLSGLYARYQAAKLSREDGEQHKQKIISIYKRYKDEYDQFKEICRIYQKQIRERTINSESENKLCEVP